MTEPKNDCRDAEEIERVVNRCTTGWTVPVCESAKDAVDSKILKTKLR